ncbi:hypothetical protein SteCoe_829 [Stentor coeruleus]|uniref:RNA helicase n=1 Tax=Stentor coeruleus TaxID=5963 RepID=A0A1R2D3C6_9CILI|nr:hypothetical protein SteCoe_829 [Stentor coeruleus]
MYKIHSLSQNRISADIREKALTSWGTRDNRDGFLDPHQKSEAEFFFEEKSEQGINFSKYSNIPVRVSEDFPVINSFEDCEIDPILLENLKRFGYTDPTPIQRYAIPISLFRKDLMACAETGSGKTIAYLYPLIAKMLQDGPPPSSEIYSSRPVAIILVPTRELAHQIQQEAIKLTYKTGIISFCAYGGVPVDAQVKQLNKGVDILIGTPGRIIDLATHDYLQLQIVRYLILDEADRMLDMGFEPQLIKILEFIKKKERETIMCSATFPQEIKQIAMKYLRDFVILSVGRVGSTTENIVQKIYKVESRDKKLHLLEVLSENPCKTLSNFYVVFVDTKSCAEFITSFLNQKGMQANSIHGDKKQFERERNLNQFKNGKCHILVATDVASRGLDIPGVELVIIYDMPNNIENYVHRIGRTGRIGNKGIAAVFIDDTSKPIIKEICTLLKECKQAVPEWLSNPSSDLMMNYRQPFRENVSKNDKFGLRFERKRPIQEFEKNNGFKNQEWSEGKKNDGFKESFCEQKEDMPEDDPWGVSCENDFATKDEELNPW